MFGKALVSAGSSSTSTCWHSELGLSRYCLTCTSMHIYLKNRFQFHKPLRCCSNIMCKHRAQTSSLSHVPSFTMWQIKVQTFASLACARCGSLSPSELPVTSLAETQRQPGETNGVPLTAACAACKTKKTKMMPIMCGQSKCPLLWQ